ncbi:hypothetical protein B0H16DRAFT_1472475 [Mycena metata]|uniref:Uncharacterized protein n=1 Tax=Mycena metata TaxID=1033252 RepID=A0AAD7HNV1_9AGAR|nr:hypothetical protein B0H16DRAFT_1472475 [Mycena metata]
MTSHRRSFANWLYRHPAGLFVYFAILILLYTPAFSSFVLYLEDLEKTVPTSRTSVDLSSAFLWAITVVMALCSAKLDVLSLFTEPLAITAVTVTNAVRISAFRGFGPTVTYTSATFLFAAVLVLWNSALTLIGMGARALTIEYAWKCITSGIPNPDSFTPDRKDEEVGNGQERLVEV